MRARERESEREGDEAERRIGGRLIVVVLSRVEGIEGNVKGEAIGRKVGEGKSVGHGRRTVRAPVQFRAFPYASRSAVCVCVSLEATSQRRNDSSRENGRDALFALVRVGKAFLISREGGPNISVTTRRFNFAIRLDREDERKPGNTSRTRTTSTEIRRLFRHMRSR